MKEVEKIDEQKLIDDQKQLEKKIRESQGLKTTGLIDGIAGAYPDDLIEEFSSSELYMDVHGEIANDDCLIFNTFSKGESTFVQPIVGEMSLEDVIDTANYKKYKSKMIEAADKIDQMVDDNYIGDDEASNTARDYLRATSSKLLRRSASGYNNNYLTYKNPLGNSGESLAPALGMLPEEGHLQNNINKYQRVFPLHQIVIDSEEQLQTFADYYKDKEKAGGKLSLEKEKEYRQKLYDQTVMIYEQYSKAMDYLTDKDNCRKLHEDNMIDKKNDPFHLHPKSARGTSPIHTGLIGMKTGLENGWAIDDIGMLSAFYNILFNEKTAATCNRSLTIDKFVEKPQAEYSTPEKKEYMGELENHWKKIQDTKLTSPKDRKELLDGTERLIRKGIDNGYIKIKENPPVQYFQQSMKQRKVRDIISAKNHEKLFYPKEENVITENRGRIDLILGVFNSKRTDIGLSNENEGHKNARLALEGLKKFNKDNPIPKKPTGDNVSKEINQKYKDDYLDYAEKYLAKLETVQHYSKKYQESRKGASSSGGKKRLQGAVEADRYANREKANLLETLKEAKLVKEDCTLDDLRSQLAMRKMNSKYALISNANAMPVTDREKRKFKDYAADIMVGRLIMVKDSKGYKTAQTTGTEVLKANIMKDKDFNRLFNSYLKDRNMNPAKFAAEMVGEGSVDRMKTINSSINKSEQKMTREKEQKAKEIADKKAAKKAADEKRAKKAAEAKAAQRK